MTLSLTTTREVTSQKYLYQLFYGFPTTAHSALPMTWFLIACFEWKFTGGEPISIFCLYTLLPGSYKNGISRCWSLFVFTAQTPASHHPGLGVTQFGLKSNIRRVWPPFSNITTPKPNLQVPSRQICCFVITFFLPLCNDIKNCDC